MAAIQDLAGGGVFTSDQVNKINDNFDNVIQTEPTAQQQLTTLLRLLNGAGISAFATGGQTSATALTAALNRVSTVATAADSVRLPTAVTGLRVVLINQGAAFMRVFGAGTDTINGIATATGVSQAIGSIVEYFCTVAGNWETNVAEPAKLNLQLLTTNGAVSPKVTQTYMITKAGVLAATLAAPVTVVDDGIIITIVSATANAHTLTATGLLMAGVAGVDLATFVNLPGAGLRIMAYAAKWYVLSSVGITFS